MFQTKSDLQQLWVEMYCSNEQVFSTCNSIVDPIYFDPRLRPVVSFVKEYYEEYHSLPSMTILNAETDANLKAVNLESHEVDYCTNEIEKFCRERAVYVEVLNASKTIETGGFASLVERIEHAVSISLNRDMGINIFENIEERMKKRQETRFPVSTGWADVDKEIGGGWCRKELLMFSASTGGGKSIAMSNVAMHMAKLGYTVLYISLELGEEFVADRFETMITEMGRDEKFARIQDVVNKMHSFQTESNGNIYIKSMEADVANSNDIKAYLKEFHMCYGKYPDCLLVDYVDILAPNTKMAYQNAFDRDKAITTQLRNLGNNDVHPMWMGTASQENRSAIGETDKQQNHIAGGLSKINTVDIYISIIMTDAMRAERMAMFKFLKTRSSGGVGKFVNMVWNPITLKFTCAGPVERTPAMIEGEKLSPQIPAQKPGTSLEDLMES